MHLDYAHPPPRDGRVLRSAIWIAAVIVGVVLVARVAIPRWQASQQEAARQAARRAAWETAMARPLAGGLVAYDEDAARAAPLLNDPGQYAALSHYARPVARRVPAEWTAVETVMGDSTPRPPILFCGPRHVPGVVGERQLVVVRLDSSIGVRDGCNLWSFTVRCLLATATGDVGSRTFRIDVPTPIAFNDWRRHPVRFFTGVSDPTDPRKFTIAYDVDGEPGVIDGEIGSVATLTVRSGPATRASVAP